MLFGPGGMSAQGYRRPDGSMVVDRSTVTAASLAMGEGMGGAVPEGGRQSFPGVVAAHGPIGGGSMLPSQLTRTAADLELAPPQITNPLLNPINFHLPYDYISLNAWIRYYDIFHPLIGNSIDMHAQYPISRFDLVDVDDPDIMHFYENMLEELDWFQFLLDMNREYWLMGECFPFGHWDHELNAWDEFVLMNPDMMVVKSLGFGSKATIRHEWKPPQEIRNLIHSNDPYDVELAGKIDPLIIQAVSQNKNIPLHPFNLTHIARKQHRYHPRGVSIILRVLKDLLYEDKLIDAQHRIADMHITPLIVYKLGDPNKSWLPSEGDLDDFRQLIASGLGNNFHSIVTHYGLQVEYHGATGRILPLVPEFQHVENRILTALFTNKAMTHGEGPTYSNAQVAAKFLNGRYMSVRSKSEVFTEEKVMYPVAIANDFYKPVPRELVGHYRVAQGERELMIPKIHWRGKLNLLDDTQFKQFMMTLRQRNELPMKMIAEAFDWDINDIKQGLKEEEGTVVDPVYQEKRKREATQPQIGGVPGGAPALPPGQEEKPEPPTPPPVQEEKALTPQSEPEAKMEKQYSGEPSPDPAVNTRAVGRRVPPMERLERIRMAARKLLKSGKDLSLEDYTAAARIVRSNMPAVEGPGFNAEMRQDMEDLNARSSRPKTSHH